MDTMASWAAMAASNSFLAGISVVGLVCGVIVLIGAIMLKVDSHTKALFGQ